jgi:transposase-like protein
MQCAIGNYGGLKMSLKQHWYTIELFFGAEICPQCGSKNVIQRGYDGYNHRHDCKDCGVETYI